MEADKLPPPTPADTAVGRYGSSARRAPGGFPLVVRVAHDRPALANPRV